MFGWINKRCKEATGHTTVPFGGISVILVGDIGQLPSISDEVIYHTKPANEIALEGYCMYQEFQTVVKLEIKGSLSSSWMNSPMQSLLLPLWQNESLSETIGMKIYVTCTVIRMKIK